MILHLRSVPTRLVLDRGVARVLSFRVARVISRVSGPQLISGLRGASRQVREWVSCDDLSPRFLDILLAIEDRRFFSHLGIDPVAVLRAVWTNLTRGTVIQGGITITQQLAKTCSTHHSAHSAGKLKESIAALVLEAKYRKQAILESYANEIYLGRSVRCRSMASEGVSPVFRETHGRIESGRSRLVGGDDQGAEYILFTVEKPRLPSNVGMSCWVGCMNWALSMRWPVRKPSTRPCE